MISRYMFLGSTSSKDGPAFRLVGLPTKPFSTLLPALQPVDFKLKTYYISRQMITLSQAESQHHLLLFLIRVLLVPPWPCLSHCDRVLGSQNVRSMDCIFMQGNEATPFTTQVASQNSVSVPGRGGECSPQACPLR